MFTEVDCFGDFEVAGYVSGSPVFVASVDGEECDVNFQFGEFISQSIVWDAVAAVVDCDIITADDVAEKMMKALPISF